MKLTTGGVSLMACGRLFQTIRPATEKTRDPWRVCRHGTWNSPHAADRKWLRPGKSVTGVTFLHMYSGLVSWTILCIIVPSLKSMQCWIESQWRSCIVWEMWSRGSRSATNRAAAFKTRHDSNIQQSNEDGVVDSWKDSCWYETLSMIAAENLALMS